MFRRLLRQAGWTPRPPGAENRSAKLTMVNDAPNAVAQEPTLVLSP